MPGFAYSDARRFLYSVGPERGRYIGMSASFAHPALGSQYTVYSLRVTAVQYIGMPWPWWWAKNHTLSIGYDGGISGGTYGVYLMFGGSVANQTGATITGDFGVQIARYTGDISNDGRIDGGQSGVYLRSSGSVSNRAGGVITSASRGTMLPSDFWTRSSRWRSRPSARPSGASASRSGNAT